MNVQEQIKKYIASQPESKRSDMQEVHDIILRLPDGYRCGIVPGPPNPCGAGCIGDSPSTPTA